MSSNLLTLLTGAIERTSGDDYIRPVNIEQKDDTPAPNLLSALVMNGYVFDIQSKVPLYIPKTHPIKSVRNGRFVGGMDLILNNDLSKVSIYPELVSGSNICIKYDTKGQTLHITGCRSEDDIRAVVEYLGDMEGEVAITAVSGTTTLVSPNSKLDLMKLALDLSKKIHSPVPEPTKSRLTVNNINNLGVSMTFFSKGSVVIGGESVMQVNEMYRLLGEWIGRGSGQRPLSAGGAMPPPNPTPD